MSVLSGPVVKSPRDKREYRGLTLLNKMKVLLISDTETDMSAASMSVAAGSMCDPADIPGLAHFCEHMLFMGTEKYPIENDYSKYLTDNGGYSNAFTARDYTNYYFNVSPAGLKGALDRFAQFFTSPLFTESATEREVSAVNSENEKDIPQDASRTYQIELATADKTHPYSYFPTGNRETLWNIPKEKGINIRSVLLDFHQKYYSANIMTLTILGKEGLDELQAITEELFLSVKNFDVAIPYWSSPYGPNELCRRVDVVPIKDVKWLTISFPIPDPIQYYKSKSVQYLSQLLGHEGPGSLLSLLKDKKLVNSLSAGGDCPARGFGLMQISVELTEEGLLFSDDIILHLFQYVKMLKKNGPQKWIWDEFRDISNITFQFKDKERPQSYVEYLSGIMIRYPTEELLSKSLGTEYRPDEISQFVDLLTPQNSQIQIVAQSLESNCNLVEPYYKIKYGVQRISDDVIEKWKNCELHDRLSLPPKNEFIPSNFDEKSRESNEIVIVPRIESNSELSRVWFLQDNEFKLPKVVIHLEISSNLSFESPLNYALNSMFVELICDSLAEESYASELAQLGYGIENTNYGVLICIAGYNHKAAVLLDKVMKKCLNFDKLSLDRFEVLKEQCIRELKNWSDEEPSHQSTEYVSWLLGENTYLSVELLQNVKELTVENMRNYVNQFLAQAVMQWFIYGNITAQEATTLTKVYEDELKLKGGKAIKVNRLKERELPIGSNYVYCCDTKTHSSSCTTVIFQCGVQEMRKNVILDLISQIASEPCFDILRTKEQLGYSVYNYTRKTCGTHGFMITVQGDRHPDFVESRINNFLDCLEKMLEGLSPEEFLQHKKALEVKKAEKPKKMSSRASLIWVEIRIEEYNFNKHQLEIEELQTISLPDVINFFKDMVATEKRRRMSVQILSMAEGGAGLLSNEVDGSRQLKSEQQKVEIEDVKTWKQQHGFFPRAQPFMTVHAF